MVMPIYEFKCPICKKSTEVIMSFGQFNNLDNTIMGECSNKKCKAALHRENQIINFAGHINMNASQMGINYRTYRNKAGGPVGIVGGTSTGKGTQKQGGKVVGRTGLV